MNTLSNEAHNAQVYLKQVPEGLLGADDFEVRDAPVPAPAEGEVLIRTAIWCTTRWPGKSLPRTTRLLRWEIL